MPLLMLWAGLEVRPATATSLAAIGLSAMAGVVTYWALGDVRPGYAALVGLPASVGAVGGTALQARLHARVVTYLFAALLVGVAVWLFVT